VNTYLIGTPQRHQEGVKNRNEILNRRGNWKEGKIGEKVDFIFLETDFNYDKGYQFVESKLRNKVDYQMEFSKDKLKNIKGIEKYLLESYVISFKENKDRYKKLFDNKIWILKPIGTYGGAQGMQIIKEYKELEDYTVNVVSYSDGWKGQNIKEENIKKFVLQEYILDPLLYRKRKFNLRIQLFIFENTGFYFPETLVFTAKDDYKKSEFQNKDIHFTQRKGSLIGIFLPNNFKIDKGKKEFILNQIEDLLKKIVKSSSFKCYKENKMCYHWFGIDAMITKDFEIKLLEINSQVGVYWTDWYEIRYPKTDKDYASVLFESQMVDIVDKIFPPKNKINDKSYFIKIGD
jgi:hypothetical protein